MDCSPPGKILQARLLEWAAVSFSRGSSQPRDRTQVSHIADRRFTIGTTREAPPKNEVKSKEPWQLQERSWEYLSPHPPIPSPTPLQLPAPESRPGSQRRVGTRDLILAALAPVLKRPQDIDTVQNHGGPVLQNRKMAALRSPPAFSSSLPPSSPWSFRCHQPCAAR